MDVVLHACCPCQLEACLSGPTSPCSLCPCVLAVPAITECLPSLSVSLRAGLRPPHLPRPGLPGKACIVCMPNVSCCATCACSSRPCEHLRTGRQATRLTRSQLQHSAACSCCVSAGMTQACAGRPRSSCSPSPKPSPPPRCRTSLINHAHGIACGVSCMLWLNNSNILACVGGFGA